MPALPLGFVLGLGSGLGLGLGLGLSLGLGLGLRLNFEEKPNSATFFTKVCGKVEKYAFSTIIHCATHA